MKGREGVIYNMKIAFYHYYWPHLLKIQNNIFKNKISEYLVIYNLIKSLENQGFNIIKLSKKPPTPYSLQKNIFIFRSGLKQIIDLIKFFICPPDVFGLVSKSIYQSKSLVPLIRFICRIKKVKFLIFMGHDESDTSMDILKNEKPYKYKENVFWDNPEDYKQRILVNNLYRPKSKNEFVIVPSKIIKNNCIKEGWPKNNIMVLPHGTDTDFFKPAKYKPDDDKFRILFAGNGATRKGLSYLLKAYELLQNKYNIELTILSHNIKDIKIPGVNIREDVSDQELLKLYQTHDIFTLPSLLDGWGLTASEAMACALPVIISNKTGVADIIQNNFNGFIVPTKNYYELYNIIKILINNKDLIIKIGNNARLTAKNFQWSDIAINFIKLLNSI